MTVDKIIEIGIDNQERLFIRPEKQTFDYIYRAAAEVGWDKKENILYSPKPREWSYYLWYRHIIAIVEEYGCKLYLTEKTKWTNIQDDFKQQIIKTKNACC